jgi:hypothetical protein
MREFLNAKTVVIASANSANEAAGKPYFQSTTDTPTIR